MWQEVDLGGGQRRCAFHDRKNVRLERQPRLPRTLLRTQDIQQDSLGARPISAHGCQRHPAFTDTEERAKVAIALRLDHDALAKFMVSNALARRKGTMCCL
jgi:hypothetical protein